MIRKRPPSWFELQLRAALLDRRAAVFKALAAAAELRASIADRYAPSEHRNQWIWSAAIAFRMYREMARTTLRTIRSLRDAVDDERREREREEEFRKLARREARRISRAYRAWGRT